MKFRRYLPFLATALGASFLANCKTPSAFDIADTNQDTSISQAEFERYLLEALYSEADTDGDAKITFEEWRVANPDAQKSKFDLPDSNGDGHVTPAELKAYFDGTGGLVDLFNQIDADGNGSLDGAEVDAFRAKMDVQAGSTDLQNLSRAAKNK